MSSFITSVLSTLAGSFSTVSSYVDFDDHLNGYRPTTLITIGVVAAIAFQALYRFTKPRWNETRVQQIGRNLLRTSYANVKLNGKLDKIYESRLTAILKQWNSFGIPYTEIPRTGASFKELVELLERYSEIILKRLEGKQISGAIYGVYSTSSVKIKENRLFGSYKDEVNEELGDEEYFTALSEKLEMLHTYGSHISHLWNTLHQNEFGLGYFINYQVVRMVASMFGATFKDDVRGFVTTGGTESLMTAARIYRNRGMEFHGHGPGEGIILAPRSVHAAIEKSCQAYLLNVEYIDVSPDGKVNLRQLDDALRRYGNKVVMIVGSAPEYSSGCVNQIAEMAEMAYTHGCGFHADCCLGGFIINLLEHHNTNYLQMKGVTSLSCDTHKNGLAPKGSSVLLTKGLYAKNAIYSIPGWDGGIYGTLNNAGSEPCTASLNALLSMLAIGNKGYKRMARSIHDKAVEFANTVKGFTGKLRLLASPEVNVVAFTKDEEWNMGKGAMYAFAHEMEKRGFTLTGMRGDRVHFCITLRYVCDKEANGNLKKAIEESIKEVEELQRKGEPFPGDAGLYGSLDNALCPDTTISIMDWAENYFLGKHGASEGVKANFLALLNPYCKVSPYRRLS